MGLLERPLGTSQRCVEGAGSWLIRRVGRGSIIAHDNVKATHMLLVLCKLEQSLWRLPKSYHSISPTMQLQHFLAQSPMEGDRQAKEILSHLCCSNPHVTKIGKKPKDYKCA